MRIRDIAKDVFRNKIEMSDVNFYFPNVADVLFDKINCNTVIYNIYKSKTKIATEYYSDIEVFKKLYDFIKTTFY